MECKKNVSSCESCGLYILTKNMQRHVKTCSIVKSKKRGLGHESSSEFPTPAMKVRRLHSMTDSTNNTSTKKYDGKEVVVCECGTKYMMKNRAQHLKSKIHISKSTDTKHSRSKKYDGKEVVVCECGTKYMMKNRAQHLKSKMHISKSTDAKHSRSKKNVHMHGESISSSIKSNANKVREIKSAFGGKLKSYRIYNDQGMKDPITYLESCSPHVTEKINEQFALGKDLKIQVVFLANFERGSDETEKALMNFKTKYETLLRSTSDLSSYFNSAVQKLQTEIEDFNRKGSNWTLKSIQGLELHINEYKPLGNVANSRVNHVKSSPPTTEPNNNDDIQLSVGGSFVILPPKIADRHAIINVHNNDNKCFIWSVLAALHHDNIRSHFQRVSHYKQFEHDFDEALKGIELPMPLKKIPLFERRTGISINVYSCEDNKSTVYPLLVTNKELDKHVDLFMVMNDETQSYHYCWIKNLSRLVNSQLSRRKGKKFICRRCLSYFYKEDDLMKHREDCNNVKAARLILPTGSFKHVQFKDFRCTIKVPFVVYADLESLLAPVSSCTPSSCDSYTERYQHHIAASFTYYVVRDDGTRVKPPVEYFGKNAKKKFITMLEEESRTIKNLPAIPMLPLTENQNQEFEEAVDCHICLQPLFEDRVHDHDHLTGQYRGAAHNACNLNAKQPNFIPIIIHNLSGFDTHLFVKAFSGRKINVLANTEERYISYSVEVEGGLTLRFIDSLRFMAKSLDGLVAILPEDRLTHTSRHFNEHEQFQLMTRKGHYPYDYLDSWEKYEETSLPPHEKFFNKLENCNISEAEYEHARRVWIEFGIRNMKEYTLLYNKSDVLLLADVFENFRNVCMEHYRLDPAWFYSAPGLAWSAMLKTTRVKLELLTDVDQILMVEKSIRGGVAVCTKRHAIANNMFMERYDHNKPPVYLTYLDANNLYGWAMIQPMPYREFEWVDTNIDVREVPDDAETGYILEVDLEYPENLHNFHNDFPLAPEHRTPPGSTTKKLMTTLYNKERYVVHYRALKLYLDKGMKLKKIHRVLSFKQSTWLKPYIELNNRLRTNANNNFETDFFKLMNNAVFGRTMMNQRKFQNIYLVTTEAQASKLISKPSFLSSTIFSEDLVAIHMAKTILKYVQPVYIGSSILDVSKTLMYAFHYDVMKTKYDENVQLLYTDTDSLIYEIQSENWYDDMKEMIEHFDTSAYDLDNPYNMPRLNKKVLGKMKDELSGKIMREFVGLRAKMYAYTVENEQGEHKRAKGVKRNVVENELTMDDYRQCLETNLPLMKKQKMIHSFHHELYTVEQNKKALSSEDDKREIDDDGISTWAWGHYARLEKNDE